MKLLDREELQRYWLTTKHALLFFPAVFVALASALSGLVCLLPLFGLSDQHHHTVEAVVLALLALSSIAALIWREQALGKRARFAANVARQDAASEMIRDLHSFLVEKLEANDPASTPENLRRARAQLEEVLDEYCVLYSVLTGTRCRTCIKLTVQSEAGEWYLFTLARDKLSQRENRTSDAEREKKQTDKLNDNSDFVALFDPDRQDEGHFLSNDLTKDSTYESSSFDYWKERLSARNRPSSGRWPLPYKSTIVWPIRQDQNDVLGLDADACVGFLAVDSPSRGVFRRGWHPHIGRALANALYSTLVLYSRLSKIAPQAGG